MKPKISVVMAVYNGVPFLIGAVISILSQTFEEFEFIIVDDCSTDNSYDQLKNFTDLRIQLYRNTKNVGLTRSLNRGMQYVNTPIVARMDADDISETYRFAVQYERMKECNLTLLGSDSTIINDRSRVLKIKRRLRDYQDIQFYTLLNNPLMHTSVMFKKECFDELGGYNCRFTYAQDYELWSRWVQKYKTENINAPLVRWRQSNKGISSVHTASQMNFANSICVSYVRSIFPEFSYIPDVDIMNLRMGHYTRSNIKNIDAIFGAARKKFNTDYVCKWISGFKGRTQYLRG